MTSQLYGLLITTGLTSVLLFALYWFVIRKQEMGEAPTGKLMTFLEMYYEGFNNLMRGLSGGKLEKTYIYLFTLFNFILLNSLTPWFGLESAATTIMFTLPLAIITFIGAFIIGVGTMGIVKFAKHRYAQNPMEIILQFAPVVSMSVRLFAATFAGAIIGNVPWIIIHGITANSTNGAWGSGITEWAPLMQILVMWVWKIIDTLLSFIQAFVFISLTIIIWSSEVGPSWSRAKRKEIYSGKKTINTNNKETTIEVIVNKNDLSKGEENG